MPKVWQKDNVSRFTGMALTRGYIRFFEPDVYVEAEPGLAALCGIENDSGSLLFKRVVSLDDFVSYKDGRPPEFAFGLNILDVYAELYSTEYRFEPRHSRKALLFEKPSAYATFAAAASGVFPDEDGLSFIRQRFLDVFEPKVRKLNARNWASALEQHCHDPLSVTNFGIDRSPDASWSPRLFIADPKSPHDIIDLWNLRLFCSRVFPINVHWLDEHREFLRNFIRRRFRPLPDSPNGVITNTTVEFGRSVSRDTTENICRTIFNDLAAGSWSAKGFYDPIWESHPEDWVPTKERAIVDVKTESLELSYEPGKELRASFPSLSPSFAARYGAHRARWVNVLSLEDFANSSALALKLPSTHSGFFSSRLPQSEAFIASREGLVLLQQHKNQTQFFRLPNGKEALRDWLKQREIGAAASDSGRIADQVLASTDGFRVAHLLSHAETIKTLDKMSKSFRKYDESETEEEYPDRTARVSVWRALINRRKQQNSEPTLGIQAFIKARALRLGLEIKCTNCEYKNWYGLGNLKEQLRCERCLQEYEFPQGTINPGNTPWHYRVTGPFSVPDYARGAYSTVLALRFLAMGPEGLSDSITYSSNLDLEFDGKRLEIDFACWYARKPAIGLCEEPTLVVGETKSFSEEAIDQADINKLKALAEKLPGTALAIAVLKDALSDREKKLVGRLALWGRKQLEDGRWRAPVIVITGTELFARHNARHEWFKSGGLRKKLTKPGHVRMDDLNTLANLTQQVYLDLSDFSSELER